MKSLGLIAVVCLGWASAASAQVYYTPGGDSSDTGRFYRAAAPVETPPQSFGGGLESEYGARRPLGDYTQLPDFQRDAAIWSMIQDILEEHFDYAFSYSSHFRGPRISLGREITADEIRNLANEAAPRYFRKSAAPRQTPPVQSAVPATTAPAARPKAILILPKSNALKRAAGSDKVADLRK